MHGALKVRMQVTHIFSLFPIPYSLFPIPYSLLPIAYSLLPTPYSLLPTPFTQPLKDLPVRLFEHVNGFLPGPKHAIASLRLPGL